ncbi:NAD-dependent epimerase/dehydratase family protein [Paludibacter sp. 221]|uniref:NAD-dependent epimerase/dehydratase family protein n=1 Tax=Paludibacter sp. 221 TaxID=2302939 RepID=UPI0013D2C3D4|nr:NAD-dependent epimerase/dehydratase family protein [Paludibacter sp. 221]NDV47262.1 NAD-dependent epimerase/dehydratase family protein [Paludibacter sp. 221]
MKTLLLTGSNGFLGRNILPLLKKDYNVLTVDINNADINSDLSVEIPDIKTPANIVLHTAGKAHSIPKTEKEKQVFFDINYQGTINLCKALENNGLPKSFIFISTVAVYGLDFGKNITEEYPLLGNTPYALSKIQAEKHLTDWCKKHNVELSILRPSLIAGPNPPGNLGDMIKGIKSGRYLSIAGGKAQKSILMIQDIANLIPLLEGKNGIYNICDNEQPSFRQLEKSIAKQLDKKALCNIPYWLAKPIACIGDLFGKKAPINSLKLKKITESLTFSNEKAKKELGWKPLSVLDNFKIN